MTKTIERWLLYKMINGQYIALTKAFKTKAAAERARMKYPERERKTIGLGLVRIKK